MHGDSASDVSQSFLNNIQRPAWFSPAWTSKRRSWVSLGVLVAATGFVGCSGDNPAAPARTAEGKEPAAKSEEGGAQSLQDFFSRNRPAEPVDLLGSDTNSPSNEAEGADATAEEASGAGTPSGNQVATTPDDSLNADGQTTSTVTESQGEGVGETPKQDVANVDANRLLSRIAELTEVQRTAPTKEKIRDTLVEQADLADQVYRSSASFQFKVSAVKTRIHALTILDKLQEPDAYQQLEEFSRSLMQRSEAQLQKMGFFGLASAQLRRYMMKPNEVDFAEIVSLADKYTAENYDDFDLGRELAAASSQLFVSGKREEAMQLMAVLRDNFWKSEQIEMQGLADALAAQIAMASVNLDKVVAKQVADEEANMPQLAEAMDQMIATGVTVALYNEMAGWMQLFEREAKYQSVEMMASKLQGAFRKASKGNDDRFLDVLETLDLILQRMDLVGKPFPIEGVELASGGTFDPSVTEGKVVLLSFWSSEADQEQRRELQFETKAYEDWRPLGVAMVGFNMDNNRDMARQFFGSNPPRWYNTRSSDPANLGYDSQFAQRAVADQTPYRILLDHEGKVAFVAVPVEQLAGRISQLLKQVPEAGNKVQPEDNDQSEDKSTVEESAAGENDQ